MERVVAGVQFVVLVVTPVADYAAEGDQQEPRPG